MLQAHPSADVQAGIQLGFPTHITDWHLFGQNMNWQFHMQTLHRGHPLWNIIYGQEMRQGSL